MSERYDVVVLGGGSAGEAVARELAGRGRTVAVVENGLVGGECPYLACMPSKAMLHAAASGRPWADAVRFRDEVAEQRDDSSTAKSLADAGVAVIRERGALTGPGQVRCGDREVEADHVIVATGAATAPAPVEGLAEAEFWTSDDALAGADLPASLAILGGGPVGCELAQVYARFGAAVTVIEPADRLLPGEPRVVGETIRSALAHDGVDVRTGQEPRRVTRDDDGVTVTLAGGATVTAERILVATGKKPRVRDIGLDTVGIAPDDRGALPVDAQCRLTADGNPVDGLWAAGDVTGIAPFTHTANYQAKIVAANICGETRRADYRAVPRVVYTDPAVFCVGRTDDGLRTAAFPVRETARAIVAERTDGCVTLFADGPRLVGAACVGPEADHWAAELTLAIRAEIDLAVLRDVVHAFPTFSEALEPAYDELCKGSVDEGNR